MPQQAAYPVPEKAWARQLATTHGLLQPAQQAGSCRAHCSCRQRSLLGVLPVSPHCPALLLRAYPSLSSQEGKLTRKGTLTVGSLPEDVKQETGYLEQLNTSHSPARGLGRKGLNRQACAPWEPRLPGLGTEIPSPPPRELCSSELGHTCP